MKFRKLVFECGLIAASVAVVSATSAVSVSAAETSADTVQTESEQNETENKEANRDSQEVAGDITEEESAEEESAEEESAEEESAEVESAEEEEAEAETSADEASEEQSSAWADKLLVVVEEDTSLNIREEPNTDSEVVGKLSRGAAAEVVEKGDGWSRIVSGDVEGYVCNEYCVFAEEAEAQAAEICDTEATATTDGVRLRSDASTDSAVYKVLEEGESLTVSDDTEETESGWVQVQYGDEVAYVSADYVDVELAVGEAVSMEEIYEQQAAEKAAEEQAAAEAAAETESASAESSSSGSTASGASSDDVALLAAIIYCEAGGESYEGQLAVGAVVMNRVKSGSFPNTISGVIYQSGQFSPASSGKLSRVLSSGSASSSCYQAAQAAINGEDNTGGAMYFHAGSGSGTVIGNQVFY